MSLLPHALISTFRNRGGATDADAVAYIAALDAAGATVSGAQAIAIDGFVIAEKAASRWSGIKRLFLPIWGSASPNAICLKTLSTGTFSGTVTHSSGFVKGDGTTGYFNTGTSPVAQGITTSNGSIFALIKTDDTRGGTFRSVTGSRLGSSGFRSEVSIARDGSNVYGVIGRQDPDTPFRSVATPNSGIYLCNRISSGMILHRRRTAGITASANETNEATLTDSQNVYALALNESSSPAFYTNAEVGLFGFGAGVASQASAEDQTNNMKTLWEACTGLTLP